MKKLLLLLLLCPFMAIAGKFYSGTITFNDGTTKTGLVDIPFYDTPKLKFKTDKKADTEKFGIEDIKEFTITDENNVNYTYLTLKFYYYHAAKRDYKIDSEKKRWIRIEKKGAIDIVTMNSVETGYHYCLHKPGEDKCYYIASYYSGFVVPIGEFKSIKFYTDLIFKEDCPQLAESLIKEEYKKDGLLIIVNNYAKLCGDKS